MHGVRVELLEQQAKNIGKTLEIMPVPETLSLDVYKNLMTIKLIKLKNQGILHSIFRDIYLEDLRQYKEDQFARIGFIAVFPLWKIPTLDLI